MKISRLAMKYMAMVLLLVGLTAVAVAGAFYWSVSSALVSRLPDVAERAVTVSLLLDDINDVLLIIGPLLLAAVAFLSLWILRRLGQPEFRLIQALQALSEGNFAAAHEAGEGGELAEIASLLREAAEKLGGMVREERRITQELLNTANALLQNPKSRELAQTLLDQLDQLQILTTRYQIKS